jgi:hypothetical protein
MVVYIFFCVKHNGNIHITYKNESLINVWEEGGPTAHGCPLVDPSLDIRKAEGIKGCGNSDV